MADQMQLTKAYVGIMNAKNYLLLPSSLATL